MVFLMDKMKDHSCAIQPAFGIGGGGGGAFNGLNFALMLDQFLNQDNLPTLVDDDDDDDDDVQVQGIIIPADAFLDLQLNPNNLTPPFEPFNYPQQLPPLTTAQSNQETGNPQPQPSVAQLVTNAIQFATQGLLNNTSGTTVSGSNNTHQPLNNYGMVTSALQAQLASSPIQPPTVPPPAFVGIANLSTVVTQAVQYQVLNDSSGSLPDSSTGDQAQVVINLASNNEFGPLQYVIGPSPEPPMNVGNNFSINIQFSPPSPDQQLPTTQEFLIVNDMLETPSTDEDSNSSVPPIQAPFSSPVYPFPSSNLNEQSEYEPSVALSDIIIIENSEDAHENQSNHTNVPN